MGRGCGENGRRSPDKASRCTLRGGSQEKRKTATEMGGLRDKKNAGIEGNGRGKVHVRQKIVAGNSSEGDR